MGPMILDMARPEKIISLEDRKYEALWRFWFGEIQHTKDYFDEQMSRWFGKDDEFDREIGEKFLELIDLHAKGELENWKKYPRGLLSLVLLTDQIPRNAFRGTPRAFEFDPVAQDVALTLCETGLDLNYDLAERIFLYLPLEHSEKPEHQELSVQKFEELCAEVAPSLKPVFLSTLDYAKRHRDIIRRFGRFPHRNHVLGRESTSEEIEFLKRPGSSF